MYIYIYTIPSPPTVDDSQPTTLLQVRLCSGKRERVKLNRTHTLNDLRNYIA